jgi:hypothetical protein
MDLACISENIQKMIASSCGCWESILRCVLCVRIVWLCKNCWDGDNRLNLVYRLFYREDAEDCLDFKDRLDSIDRQRCIDCEDAEDCLNFKDCLDSIDHQRCINCWESEDCLNLDCQLYCQRCMDH